MLYAALYFGQQTFIVTNDEFRDHRHVLLPELQAKLKLWQRQRQITFNRNNFTGKFRFNVSCALLKLCFFVCFFVFFLVSFLPFSPSFPSFLPSFPPFLPPFLYLSFFSLSQPPFFLLSFLPFFLPLFLCLFVYLFICFFFYLFIYFVI